MLKLKDIFTDLPPSKYLPRDTDDKEKTLSRIALIDAEIKKNNAIMRATILSLIFVPTILFALSFINK